MGRVLAPYGVQGWVKVAPYTQAPDALLGYGAWWLRRAGETDWKAVEPTGGKLHGTAVIAGLRGIETREAALALKGAEIGVARSDLPPAEDDEVYWEDLIGLLVVNRQGEVLGRIAAIGTHGAHPVLTVREDAAEGAPVRERLIPYVPAVIESLDREAGRLEVEWGADY